MLLSQFIANMLCKIYIMWLLIFTMYIYLHYTFIPPFLYSILSGSFYIYTNNRHGSWFRPVHKFVLRSSFFVLRHTSLQKNVNGGVEPWSLVTKGRTLVTKGKDPGDQRETLGDQKERPWWQKEWPWWSKERPQWV